MRNQIDSFVEKFKLDKDRMDMVALVFCLLAVIFWVVLLSYKFYCFGYYDWDFAFFAQAMWSLTHGSGYASLFDINLLANHANLIAYVIIPLFKIFPYPLTLIFLKVISYVTAAFVLYLLAKEKLGPTTAIIFLWLYLIYTPNVIGIVYEFDFESLAPAFLMLIFYFYVKDRWLGFLICAGILILIKENLPLIVLAFSIHGLFVKKDKIRWALIPGILAVVSFYLLVFVLMPYVSGRPIGEAHPYYIGNNYKDFGGSIGGVLFSLIFHPIKVLHCIMTPSNLNFLSAVFAPFMCLPLASPGVLFLISPILIQHLLSSSITEHSIRFAYVLTIAPFLFIGTVETLGYFYKNKRRIYNFILIIFVSFNIAYFYVNLPQMKERFMVRQSRNQTKEMVRERWKLFHMVPQDASVVASFPFLAPLSQRKNLFAFHKIYDAKYQNGPGSLEFPPDVQYALIDYSDTWLVFNILTDPYYTRSRINKFFNQNKWIEKGRYGTIVLFERVK